MKAIAEKKLYTEQRTKFKVPVQISFWVRVELMAS